MKVSELSTRKKMTMKEFAALAGIKYSTFHLRLMNGHSVMRAATMTEQEARSSASRKHGMHGTPEYSTWESMHQRCRRHGHYVARNIQVCDSWGTFEVFFADMGPRPVGATLDRIDGSKGYEPDNCRWATPREQAQNTSRNRLLTHGGETKPVAEWARITGTPERRIRHRLDRGYTPEQALFQPAYKRRAK